MKKVLLVIAIVIIIAAGYCAREHYFKKGDLLGVEPIASERIGVVDTDKKIDSPAALKAQFFGRWVSVDDPKYEVEQNVDGTLKEYYDGSQLSVGSWALSEEIPEGLVLPEGAVFTGVYLTKELDGEESYYGVLTSTDADFSMTYFDRGNTVSFTRVVNTPEIE